MNIAVVFFVMGFCALAVVACGGQSGLSVPPAEFRGAQDVESCGYTCWKMWQGDFQSVLVTWTQPVEPCNMSYNWPDPNVEDTIPPYVGVFVVPVGIEYPPANCSGGWTPVATIFVFDEGGPPAGSGPTGFQYTHANIPQFFFEALPSSTPSPTATPSASPTPCWNLNDSQGAVNAIINGPRGGPLRAVVSALHMEGCRSI